MLKYDYVKEQMAKTNKKNDENYVVTRLWHKLDNENIKFITQQYVVRANGKYALTDMFFPQLDLHVEIDEGYHFDEKQAERDRVREQDIVGVTNHEIRRINTTKELSDVHEQIDHVVNYINEKIDDMGDAFVPWDVEEEYSPEAYIEKGKISLSDNVAFKTIKDAANVLGHNYQGFQQGSTRHPHYDDTIIWFPKLFPNDDWDNKISPDEKVIREKNNDEVKTINHLHDVLNNHKHKRVVFAKVKGPLGRIMYKFKGKFELDITQSKEEGCLVWNRVSTTVTTFPPKIQD